MRFSLFCGTILLTLVAASSASELPEAPSTSARSASPPPAVIISTSAPAGASAATSIRGDAPVIDKKFVALTIVETGSTFADSYTTLFARENWLAGKQGVCNIEVESAYLYGTHPTVVRAYAVASVKSVGSVFLAYYLRKHHSRFWSLPMAATSIMSLQGVGQNLVNCN